MVVPTAVSLAGLMLVTRRSSRNSAGLNEFSRTPRTQGAVAPTGISVITPIAALTIDNVTPKTPYRYLLPSGIP